jgi:hypothetical protein
MFRVIRKSEAKERKIADNKSAFNYITKEISLEISLAVIEGTDFAGEINLIGTNSEVLTLGFRNNAGDGWVLIEPKNNFVNLGSKLA